MELTRIIHPVGQGGFYSETFRNGSDEINIVYDCGGNSKSSIESYIENYYPSKLNRKIDAVFISHLHDDHINGLDYLLKKCNVKYLFLPQLTDDENLEIMFYSIIKTGAVSNVILQLLFSNVLEGRETEIIRVSHDNGDNRVSEEINTGDYDLSNSNNSYKKLEKTKEISSGTTIGLWDEWLFIPYNPPVINNRISFYDYIKQELQIISHFKPEDLPYIIMDEGIKLNELKKVYESYFGKNHNAYSMALFSGLPKPHPYYDYCDDCFVRMKRHCHYCRIRYGKERYCMSPNCLYLGDYDTQNQFYNLNSFYAPFWKTISSIQVPHHGSRNNFNPYLYEYAHNGFISVGERNRYHHPNVETLIGMDDMVCKPVIVTEGLSTMRRYHYSF